MNAMTRQRLLRRAVLGAVLLCGTSCKGLFSELVEDVADVPIQDIVDVSLLGPGLLRPNGTDTTRVRVRLPGRATNPTARLSTSAGTWVESVNSELLIRLTLDSAGAEYVGSALLRAPRDTEPRLAVIRATVADTYYDTVSVRFVP